VITYDTGFRWSASAVSMARSISLYPSRSNPTVKTGRPGQDSAASAQRVAESTPPDRNAPTGTSPRRCIRTESRSAARIFSGLLDEGDLAGRNSGRQYLNTSTRPPGRAIRTCPGGRARAGGTMVAGAGTYWNDRYRRSASGSIAVTSPESASALRSEANLSWGLGLDPGVPLAPGWR
jgi:hypothetical protein